MSQFKPAIKLREIREFCSPRPLLDKELDSFFVETVAGRDPECAVRRCIQSVLDAAVSPKRILLHGHKGCGKSTELIRLAEDLGEGWLCVKFSILAELSIFDIQAEEVLLVIAHKLVEAAREANLTSLEQDEKLREVSNWFSTVTNENKSSRDTELGIGAGAKVGTGGWLFGLGDLFANFSSAIKFRGSSQTTIIEAVRKRPGDLVVQVNRVVESIQNALQATDRRLLIVVEDMDKLNIAAARRVFVENAILLTGINAHIIYTIPIFTFYSPDASSIRTTFDEDFSLPMIKVMEKNSSRAEGFDLVKQIVYKRVAKEAIDDDALELLVEKTGGVLRHVFEALHTATTMTSLREPPIQRRHIEYALKRLKSQIGLEIALPVGQKTEGLENVKQLYQKLEEYAKLRKDGKDCPKCSEPIVQVLLQSCALVEYNGTGWLAVHPLALEYLKDLGYNV